MKFQDWQNKQEMNKKKKQTNQELLEVLSEINNKEEIDYSETLQGIKKIVDEKSIDLSEVISTIKGIKLEQKEVDLSSVVKAIENIPKPEKVVIPEQKEDKKTHSLLEKISKWEFPKSFWLNKDQFKSLINNLKEITDAVEKVKTSVSVSGGGFSKVGLASDTKQDEIIIGLEKLKQDFSVRNKEETVDYKFVGFEILGKGDWKIMRIDLNSTEMETLYAVGTSDYATNWANRLTINYN